MKKLIFTLFLLSGGVLLAQDTNIVSTNSVPVIEPIDINIAGFIERFSYFKFLIAPTVLVLLQVFKKFVVKIPSGYYLYAAPFLGVILDFLAAKAGFWVGDPAIGALIGSAASWLYSLPKQTTEITGDIKGTPNTNSNTPNTNEVDPNRSPKSDSLDTENPNIPQP